MIAAMFFHGMLSPSVKLAYLLTLLGYLTIPIHFFSVRGSVNEALLILSMAVVVFSIVAGMLCRPRHVAVIVYSFIACVIHGVLTPRL